jgi:hypothetical protein
MKDLSWRVRAVFPTIAAFAPRLGELFRQGSDGVNLAVEFPSVDWGSFFEPVLSTMGEVDLADCLVACWSKHVALDQLRESTRADPSQADWLKLVEHDVESVHQAEVEIVLDGVPIADFTLDLSLNLTFSAAVLEVRGGEIFALEPGHVAGGASIGVSGVEIGATEHRVLTLPGRWVVGSTRSTLQPRAVVSRAG